MLNYQELTNLVTQKNIDAINSIYWELSTEYQRMVDQLIAKMWDKEISGI